MTELQKTYVTKLSKMLNVEETIIKALPTMISKATNADLKAGLSEHLTETKAQRDRLIEILGAQGGTSLKEVDAPFKMMVEEAGGEIAGIKDTAVRDAVIIAAAQSVEHIKMARYGTLVEWARQLGDSDSQTLLEETLAEEQAADRILTGVAEGGIFTAGVNEEAAE
jgi:ferritin-like metal-binding protein YciE